MAVPDRVIMVRTFESEEEIRKLEGFIEDNLVTQENYADLLGDYRLRDQQKCCLFRDGRRCSAKHNYGFVVILKDQSVSIVGNLCGNTKFGAESKLARDMRQYENEKLRLEAQARLKEILAGREKAEAEVARMYGAMKELADRTRVLLDGFPNFAANRLRNMARAESGRVLIIGIRQRHYTDDEGNPRVEKTPIDIFVGSLSGMSIFKAELTRAVQDELRMVTAGYREAESLDDSATTATLNRIASAVSQLPRILDSGQRLLDAENAFNESDWTCLPFLVSETGDRVKLARAALTHANLPAGKDRAKEWLTQMDAALKVQHNVQRLAW